MEPLNRETIVSVVTDLLETYVRMVLAERYHSKTFDMSKFKAMRDLEQIQDYALHNLEELGLGSSRAAYLLNGRYVLKVAQNFRGVAQNTAEAQIASDPRAAKLVARVVQRGPKSYWLLSELVRPLTSEGEFTQLTGLTFSQLRDQLKDGSAASGFAKLVVTVAHEMNLETQDLVRLSSWGRVLTVELCCWTLDTLPRSRKQLTLPEEGHTYPVDDGIL